MRYGWIILFSLMLVACGNTADDTAPVERVKAFVAASEARDVDQMVSMIAPDNRRDAGWQLRQMMPAVTSIEYRDAQYQLADNDGTTAHVQVVGTVTAQMDDGRSVDVPTSQLVELSKQDGIWYITSNGVQPPTVPGN